MFTRIQLTPSNRIKTVLGEDTCAQTMPLNCDKSVVPLVSAWALFPMQISITELLPPLDSNPGASKQWTTENLAGWLMGSKGCEASFNSGSSHFASLRTFRNATPIFLCGR